MEIKSKIKHVKWNQLRRGSKVLYEGNMNTSFVEDVRIGKYDVTEGVVCKGINQKKSWMAKVKTYAYLERLKSQFKDEWEKYWE